MDDDRPSPAEIYNTALECYLRADLDEAVAWLRLGFFENLYVAPVLLGQEYEEQNVWYPAADASPRGASEYARRYGHRWRQREDALCLLRDVWSDYLVRGEIRNFINLSKSIPQAGSAGRRQELIRERERFLDARRIRRTQREIVARLRLSEYGVPVTKPRIALLMLASRDPERSVEFYRRLFRVDPVTSSTLAGGFAEFDLPGVRLAIHGHDRLAEGDPYGLGSPPESYGWGAILVIRVSGFDRYHDSAVESGIEVIDRDLETAGCRFFVVRDPSGYLIEVTEEPDPRGL